MNIKAEAKEVLKLSNELRSYAEVGRQLGITRERVRQICSQKSWNPPEGYVTIYEAMRLLKYCYSSVRGMIDRGVLPGTMHNGKWYVKVGNYNPGDCEICGKPIAKNRRKFCSLDCARISIKASWSRRSFRSFKKKRGQKIDTPYLAYRNPYESRRTVHS